VRPLALARWLLAIAVLVVLMVTIGGITRLTESGLSITEWKPVTGALPPLTERSGRPSSPPTSRSASTGRSTGPRA
jgi:cytochrome c oxidase assembly protein subunit 15